MRRRPGPATAVDGPPPDAPAFDARPVVTATTAGLGALYAALTVMHPFFLTGSPRTVMVAVAGGSTALLLTGHVAVRRRRGPVSARWMDVVPLVPITNSLTHLAVTGELHQTTTVMLTLIGIAVGVRSGRSALALGLLAVAGWTAVVALRPVLQGAELGHYAVQLAMAAALAVLAHRVLAHRARLQTEALREAENSSRWFRSMFDASPVGVGVADDEGRFVSVNPALCRLLGRSEEQLLGRSSLEFTHPDDRPGHARAGSLITAAADGVARVEKRYVRPDGEIRWAWLAATHTRAPDGRRFTLAHVQDVTAHRAAEQAVHDSERNLAAVATVARRIRTGENPRPLIVEAVRTLAEATSVTVVERCPSRRRAGDGEPPVLMITASDDEALVGTRIPLSATSVTAEVYRTGTPVFLADPAADPRTSPALLALSGARSMLWQPVVVDGRARAVIAVTWDLPLASLGDQRAAAVALLADEAALALEHEALLARLEVQAGTDELTGLPNRRAWARDLDELMRRAKEERTPLTVAIADLDHFKEYNDTHGHAAGDDLLVETARRLSGVLRPHDVIARWGGEEFTVALPDCAGADAPAALERIRRAVPRGRTCSVGFATWDTLESAENLLARADAALYAAKGAGRDRVVGAPPRSPDDPPLTGGARQASGDRHRMRTQGVGQPRDVVQAVVDVERQP